MIITSSGGDAGRLVTDIEGDRYDVINAMLEEGAEEIRVVKDGGKKW